jgi:glycosyltransferase involved in cell wall biosynthesis
MKPRVAILTSGRFHVLDLARELSSLGFRVLFYSLVPPWRTHARGLPLTSNRWLGPAVGGVYLASRLARGSLAEPWFARALNEGIDAAAALTLERCDALIAMSGMALRTARAARSKFGARVYIERSSRHILSQRAILEALPGTGAQASPIPEWVVTRELQEYADADTVVIPSDHVRESFLERGFAERRLFTNPFGVSLSEFPPTTTPPRETKRILMVGGWSYRKGVDVLVDAFVRLRSARSDVELHHVGPVIDAPLPSGLPGFHHHAPVPQSQLSGWYARCHVFGLASREEGLATVQLQALASGLPLVCTTRTGGRDLRGFVERPEAIFEVPPDDPVALSDALDRALTTCEEPGTLRNILGTRGRDALTWRSYGERWAQRLTEDLGLRARH